VQIKSARLITKQIKQPFNFMHASTKRSDLAAGGMSGYFDFCGYIFLKPENLNKLGSVSSKTFIEDRSS